MTAELGDWLAELAESEPATAAEVSAALVAVLRSAEPAGLALVDQPGRRPEPVKDDPREVADYAYQQQLAQLQHLRRQVAEATGVRRAAELALSAQQSARAEPAVLATLAERLADARLHEDALAQLSQRMRVEVDTFGTARDTAKARYTAAEASLRIAEAIEVAGGQPDPDLPQRLEDLRSAEERLLALRWPGTQTVVIRHPTHQTGVGRSAGADRPEPPPPAPPRNPKPVPGLLELRADPLGSDIRVLFGEEPADTVTLLAVLEGSEAVSQHGTEATRLAGDLLTEIRDEGWPTDIAEVVLADPDDFVAQFFPADDGSIGRRADALAATTSFGRLRAERHMTVDEVAVRSGVPRHRVEAIERDGLRAAHVHEAVALARALGARLELPAGEGPVAG
jgi:DNA-binding XRE family transcriptional regulator